MTIDSVDAGEEGGFLLSQSLADMHDVSPAIAEFVFQRWREAQRRWPRVHVPLELFGRHLIARLPSSPAALHEQLVSVRTDDLYLACACAYGHEPAIDVLEQELLPHIDAQVERILGSGASDDVKQLIRCKVLLGSEDEPPRIAYYDGYGALLRWLRVVGVREALMEKRRQRAHTSEEELLSLASSERDVDLDYMQRRYGAEFRHALKRAFSELASVERTLLRYHLIDRMSLEQIAAIDGSHKSSASRRLARVRAKLEGATKHYLMEQLAIGQHELASIMRMIRSNVDISAYRLLSLEA